ncbi:hypothetical protein KA013_05390 [Patescibacteria group bacterium]|nr:hypothetical protein [Patescibacteria group bacterium]
MGHTITELGPSLNSFLTEEKRIHELMGTAFPEAVVKGVLANGEKIASKGPVLLTHF